MQLRGWTRERRVIVSRQKMAEQKVDAGWKGSKQPVLPGTMVEQCGGDWYQCSVLVTSWEERNLGRLTQESRNRADAQNMFDELQAPQLEVGAWTGYTTRNIKTSQLMARLVALVYNWWSIFTRMGTAGQHREVITTRPALIYEDAQQTEHAREVKLEMTSVYRKSRKIDKLFSGMSEYLHHVLARATQLDEKAPWSTLPRKIFR